MKTRNGKWLGRPLGAKTLPKDGSLKSITPKVVKVMKDLRFFDAQSLLDKLNQTYSDDKNIVRRRLYDITGVLLGAGMISRHPQTRKTYVFDGLSGVATRLKKLQKNTKMPCPFPDRKQLRNIGWECMRLFAKSPIIEEKQIVSLCGSRRLYDVDAVLRGAGILDFGAKGWELHSYFRPADQRITLREEDMADIANLFNLEAANIAGFLNPESQNKDIFIF